MTKRAWTKARAWNGKGLKGRWNVTIKIDGVRAFRVDDGYVSRNGKPLYNIPLVFAKNAEGYEVYRNSSASSKANFKATIQAVRAKTKARPLSRDDVFVLEPLDPRLFIGTFENPSADFIREELARIVGEGCEGLVLRGPKGEWLKVKPSETYDVRVTGYEEGEGKHAGRLGALVTTKGKVGTGFSDEEREALWADRENLTGRLVEVSCMHLTADGQFRHPAFERFRDDKDEAD